MNENDYTRLAPIGVIGELLIEGPLLARGYLKDPDKTSRAFVKDPSWLVQLRKRSGLRLYRTGDLARWDTDGTIIFVGRKDSQVKLRGQRIEAGEVEHHLRKCLPSGTAVCVTIITPTGQGQSPKLAAFVGVGHKIHNEFSQALINLSVEERGFRLPLLQGLKERLSSSLPAYMVPSYYIPLTYIPLTVSGKINRQLLNEVGSSLTISDILELGTTNQGISDHTNSSLEIKNNTMERRMVELWKRILHCEDRILGPQDNFFKLGGDSINVMQLVKAAKDIGIGLDTTQAFQHPTVAGMSAVASQATTDPKIYPTQLQDPHKATSTDGLTDDVFCPGLDPKHDEIEDIADATDLQAYMVVCGLLKTRGYINYFAFDLTGPIDADRLEQACCSLVQRHSALRTVFGLRAGRVLQIVLKAMNLEFVRSADCPRTETLLAKLCEVDKACSAQLGDKIVRFMFASRDPHKHVLIMRISHAQFDGTSLGLIYRDLKLAYQGAIIPPGPNFIDVSLAMQHANNSSAELFWSKLLHKSSMTSIIHQSRTSFAHVINSRVTTLIPWPSIQSHIPGITIATIVKAAWALVLSSLSSSKDIVFAYAVAGRNIPLSGIDHVVGDCNNAALLRLQLSQHHTILSLLEEIQTQYLAMIPYETMGMRQVIERCTDWPRWTRYSSSVNHQNYADAGVDEFHFGEKEEVGCRVSYRDLEADRRDVQIYSWPPREGYLRVDMAFCKDAIPHAVVENMLGELAATILHVATKADTPLIIPPSIPSSESLPRLPIMAANHHLANSTTISQPAPPPQPAPIAFRFSLLNPESIVKTVWTKFLATLAANNPIRNGLEEIVTSDTPFYDLGGDLVDAAQLSAFYEQEGVVITMEELIEWPTQRGQRGLVGGLLL